MSFILSSVVFYGDDVSLSQHICTQNWYEEVFNLKSEEVTQVHFAVSLYECFAQDPSDIQGLVHVIEHWIDRGGDINETFFIKDFVNIIYCDVANPEIPAMYKNYEKITILMLFISVGYMVEILMDCGAKIWVDSIDHITFWQEQYMLFEKEMKGIDCPDFIYELQHQALKTMVSTLSNMDRVKLMSKKPSLAKYIKK